MIYLDTKYIQYPDCWRSTKSTGDEKRSIRNCGKLILNTFNTCANPDLIRYSIQTCKDSHLNYLKKKKTVIITSKSNVIWIKQYKNININIICLSTDILIGDDTRILIYHRIYIILITTYSHTGDYWLYWWFSIT